MTGLPLSNFGGSRLGGARTLFFMLFLGGVPDRGGDARFADDVLGGGWRPGDDIARRAPSRYVNVPKLPSLRAALASAAAPGLALRCAAAAEPRAPRARARMLDDDKSHHFEHTAPVDRSTLYSLARSIYR